MTESTAMARPELVRRELILISLVVAGMGRLVEPPGAWVVALFLVALLALGSRRAIGDVGPVGPTAPESAVMAGVAGFGIFGALHLVPVGLLLLPALAAGGFVLQSVLVLEMHLATRPNGPTPADRSGVVGFSLLLAFIAFTGVAALVPGGMVFSIDAASREPLTLEPLLTLVIADAAVAAFLGYRMTTMRTVQPGVAIGVGLGYGFAIAIASGFLRAVALPRLLGPAILTLFLFLWESIVGTAPGARRNRRFFWEIALLVVLALAVTVWNLAIERA